MEEENKMPDVPYPGYTLGGLYLIEENGKEYASALDGTLPIPIRGPINGPSFTLPKTDQDGMNLYLHKPVTPSTTQQPD